MLDVVRLEVVRADAARSFYFEFGLQLALMKEIGLESACDGVVGGRVSLRTEGPMLQDCSVNDEEVFLSRYRPLA